MATTAHINMNSKLRAHTHIHPHAVFFLYSNIQIHRFVWYYPPSEAANSGSAQHSRKIKWAHKSAGKISAGDCCVPTLCSLEYKSAVLFRKANSLPPKAACSQKNGMWEVTAMGGLLTWYQFSSLLINAELAHRLKIIKALGNSDCCIINAKVLWEAWWRGKISSVHYLHQQIWC